MRAIKQTYDASTPLERLSEHPDNPRRGNDDVVSDSVDVIGFYGAIVAQVSTGHVLAGNTRLRVARANGAETVPVVWVDVDDDTARKILLVDNRASDLASYDDDVLAALLTELSSSAGLLGTGYDANVLDALIATTTIENIVDEATRKPTPDEQADAYEARGIRSIILPYEVDDYMDMVERLGELRERYGLDTNAECLLRLVREATE